MTDAFQVAGSNDDALFTLKLHRGEGDGTVAMNWKIARPPDDFVGFAIEYKEPGGDRFYALKNRIAFPASAGAINPSRLSPIQMFRWVHFPRNAELASIKRRRRLIAFGRDGTSVLRVLVLAGYVSERAG